MKKLLFLTAAAAVAFSSCTKDLAEVASIESQDVVSITASMGDETRTYLDGGYRWSKGDALGVFVKGDVNNAKNVAFTLDPIYDGQKTGKFISNNTALLDAENEKFFAYYPHTPGMSAADVLGLDLKVLAEQNYQPGSFATLTAPSVADDFSLTESVTMQPVADYVKVYVNGVDDIKYLTLAIKYGNAWLNLTDVELAKYLLKANSDVKDADADVRYALVPSSFKGKNTLETSLKLNCGRLDETVVCHNDNEYVFVVPAGILRTESADVKVYLGVNHDVAESLDEADKGKSWFEFNMSADKQSQPAKSIGDAQKAIKDGVSLIQLENTVHSLNTAADAVVYNPTGKFIIHNELDFLQYMNEYGVAEDKGGLGYVDAYVCGPMEDARNGEVPADYDFNFTPEHMNELATSFKGEAAEMEKLNKYVSDYIANGIPCIEYYYNAFEGNGAIFNAIKGLQSSWGMFGWLGEERNPNLVGRIENLTLKNVKGANTKGWDCILAYNASDYSSIENVTIENASEAEVIMRFGDVDNLKGINLTSNNYSSDAPTAGVWYLFFDFALEQDMTIDPEEYPVPVLFYQTGARAYDAVLREGQQKGHNVITVEESADPKATFKKFGKIDADRDDELCVSVVINNESWWTNDTIAPAEKQNNSNKPNYGYVEINYAEQLKYGDSTEPIALTRNMQMNGFDWGTAVVAPEINGNGKTINGITWSLKDKALYDLRTGVAPFAANTVKKLTVEGQTFNFITDGTRKNPANSEKVHMPAKIAGLTLSATDVQDVKINNFVIFAKDAADSEASLFDDVQPYYGDGNIPSIGWAVVKSTDGLFKNIEVNVTSSNVKGEAGLINTIELKDNAESQVTNVKANVAAMEQTALNSIEAYDVKKHNNVAGTPVFKLINGSAGAARSIKFTECGAPALTYEQVENGNQANKINVLNGNTLVGTYNCFFVK